MPRERGAMDTKTRSGGRSESSPRGEDVERSETNEVEQGFVGGRIREIRGHLIRRKRHLPLKGKA